MVGPSLHPAPQIRLERSPQAATQARRFVERELAAKCLPTPVLDDIKLVTSELVTNAFQHGAGTIEMRLAFPGESVRVEVIDQGTDNVPAVREQRADDTGGLGLRIVDRLSEQWGVFEGTTHVWADLAIAR